MPNVAIAAGALAAIVVVLVLQIVIRGESFGWAIGPALVTALAFVVGAATHRRGSDR